LGGWGAGVGPRVGAAGHLIDEMYAGAREK
jgi:hypothetical protein